MATGYRSCIRARDLGFARCGETRGRSRFVRDELPRSGGGGRGSASTAPYSPTLVDGATFDHISFAVAAAAALLRLPASGGCAQVRLSGKLATTAFEDSLVEAYRDILKDLPVESLIAPDDPLDDEVKRHLTGFYRYFDLCNQQVFLRHQLPPRITAEVWNDWRDGIDAHLHRASFQRAWQIIGEGTFNRNPRISFFNGLRPLRSGNVERRSPSNGRPVGRSAQARGSRGHPRPSHPGQKLAHPSDSELALLALEATGRVLIGEHARFPDSF